MTAVSLPYGPVRVEAIIPLGTVVQPSLQKEQAISGVVVLFLIDQQFADSLVPKIRAILASADLTTM